MKRNFAKYAQMFFVGLIILLPHLRALADPTPSDPHTNNFTNRTVSSTNKSDQEVSSPGGTNGIEKMITDEKTGQYVSVNKKKDTVTLCEKDGKILWTTNVIEGLKDIPKLAGRRIKGMQIRKGDIWVDVGRGYAVIDIRTGQLLSSAMN